VRPTEQVRIGGGIRDSGRVNHGVAIGSRKRQAIRVTEVAYDPIDVVK
jgi:hypothetical protein